MHPIAARQRLGRKRLKRKVKMEVEVEFKCGLLRDLPRRCPLRSVTRREGQLLLSAVSSLYSSLTGEGVDSVVCFC